MAARGEVRVRVSFGPTSSPVLAHAVSYAIEHAWRTEELLSGAWEASFRIERDERAYGELRHLLSLVGGWKTTRVEVEGSTEYRQVVHSMLSCAREWLRSKGSCGARFASTNGAPRCRLCPLYDAGYAGEFWVQPEPLPWPGGGRGPRLPPRGMDERLGPEQLVEGADRVLLHGGQHVGVDVERDPHRRVAEPLGDHLGMDAL